MGGVQTHPLVPHFVEEHSGMRQDYLMRSTNFHEKALERQVLESIRIEEGSLNQEERGEVGMGVLKTFWDADPDTKRSKEARKEERKESEVQGRKGGVGGRKGSVRGRL